MSSAPSQSLNTRHLSDQFIVWAVLVSFLLHVVSAWLIPNLSFEDDEKPEPLKVELIKVPAVVEPEPAKPLPPKPKKKLKPKIIKKPKPIKKIAPLPPVPQAFIPDPEPLPAYVPPPVIAVEPTLEPRPKPIPPVPVVTPPPGPSPSEINAAKGEYMRSLKKAMNRHKRYPRIAKTRGWQGKVIIEFSLNNKGEILTKKIIQSSGYASLDKQALTMAEKAAPFPLPPQLLRDDSFTIKVPIPFKLAPQ